MGFIGEESNRRALYLEFYILFIYILALFDLAEGWLTHSHQLWEICSTSATSKQSLRWALQAVTSSSSKDSVGALLTRNFADRPWRRSAPSVGRAALMATPRDILTSAEVLKPFRRELGPLIPGLIRGMGGWEGSLQPNYQNNRDRIVRLCGWGGGVCGDDDKATCQRNEATDGSYLRLVSATVYRVLSHTLTKKK